MLLICPSDRRFPNGPAYTAGEPVDVDELAEAIGHTDPGALADALVDQGWSPADSAPAAAGTIDEVLAAVGLDPAAARSALDAELARARPRKKLVALLEGLATVPAEGTDTEES